MPEAFYLLTSPHRLTVVTLTLDQEQHQKVKTENIEVGKKQNKTELSGRRTEGGPQTESESVEGQTRIKNPA